MKVSFSVDSKQGDVYLISLSSGPDAFFVQEDILNVVGKDIEIVEIDLERIAGNNPTGIHVLAKIAEGIAKYFQSNSKAVLYYYCDDLSDLPMNGHTKNIWPQEYRSRLFSIMYNRYIASNPQLDMMDAVVTIDQGGRPLYMHLIARRCHSRYIEKLKAYIMENYGK